MATKLYENAIVALRGRKGLKEYMRSPGLRFAAIFVNFNFQCFTLLFFSQGDWRSTWSALAGLVAAVSGHTT